MTVVHLPFLDGYGSDRSDEYSLWATFLAHTGNHGFGGVGLAGGMDVGHHLQDELFGSVFNLKGVIFEAKNPAFFLQSQASNKHKQTSAEVQMLRCQMVVN